MAKEKVILLKLDLDVDKYVKGLVQAEARVKGLKKAQDDIASDEKDNEAARLKALKAEEEALAKATQQAQELAEAIQQVGDTLQEEIGLSPRQQELLDNITDTKVAMAELAATNKTLKAGLATAPIGSEQFVTLTKALAGNEAQLRNTRGQLNSYQKQLDNLSKQNNAAAGSYEQLLRQYEDAQVQLKLIGDNIKYNADGTPILTEAYKKQAAEVKKLKEGLLEFNKGILDGRLNVGNYAESLGQYFDKVENAARGTGAFGEAIGTIRGAITQTSAGVELLKDSVQGIKDGFNLASQGVTNFFSSTTKGGTFETFNDGAEDAVSNITELGSAGEASGKRIAVGTNIGANGFKTLRVALISTGIGAIVVAVGSLIGYFATLQSVTDKLKGVFDGLTAIFKTYLQSVFDIAKALATLDFKAAFNGLTGFFGKAKDAASAAYDLNEAKIALEKTDINNIALQDELNDKAERNRLLADDKTKTDLERIKLIQEANDAEKQSLEIQYEREKQAVAIAKAEVDAANKTGEATREQLKAYEELKVKAGDVQDAILNKEAQTLAETGKLRKQFLADNIKAEIDLLNNKLKIQELSGKESFELQRSIAKQERDALLLDTQINDKQREVIEDNYQTKLAEIRKAAGDAEKQRLQQLEEFRINTIFDGQTREIAAVALATQQKLDAVIKDTEQEQEIRRQIELEGARQSLEIAQKYAQQTQDERLKVQQSNLDLQTAEVDSEAKKQQDILALELSALNTKEQLTAEELAFQQDAANKSLQIEEEALKRKLDLQLKATGERIATEQAYYDGLEEAAKKNITDEGALAIELANIQKQRNEAELKTEQETGAQITAITDAINNNRVQQTINSNNAITENNKKLIEEQAALNEVVTDTIVQGLNSIAEILGLSEANQKKYAGVLKAISLAELTFNLQKEISGYWAGVGRDTATGGFILGTVSSAKATAQTIAASIRYAAGTAKILTQKFADGGYTAADAIQQYNPRIVGNFSGGYVTQPTMWSGGSKMNLAGEAGTEWVGANWQIKQAPELFAGLEQWRRTGVRPFADGGFTLSQISQPLIQNANMLEAAIIRGFSFSPAPVVSVAEINNVQNRVSVIESRATL